MNSSDKILSDPSDDQSLTPEIRALMGVYAIYTQVEGAFQDADHSDGLPDTARHVLVRLERPARMGELARVTKMSPSALTAQIDTLEQAGFVTRERDASDRRAWIIALTPKGETLRAELVRFAGALFHRITGFDDAQTAAFADLVDRVRRNILTTMIDRSRS